MAKTRSTDSSEVWRSLLVTFTSIYHELAAELEDRCSIAMEHYEVLLLLYEAGGSGLRPSDLANQRRLSRSGATRLIDRLESDGLVVRRTCEDDRRGSLVSLTSKGRRSFVRAGRVHLDGIESRVGACLTHREMADLRRLLSKLSVERGP